MARSEPWVLNLVKSTLLPWLFFGPLFGIMFSNILWSFTKWEPAKWLMIACGIWVVLFAVTAFLANYLRKP
jgi:hypothetical protein